MKKVIITGLLLVSISLVSCGPSKKEVLEREIKQELAEMDRILDTIDEINITINHCNKMYAIEDDIFYVNRVEELSKQANKLLEKNDSIGAIIDNKIQQINKLN
jgi:hypothetical protein